MIINIRGTSGSGKTYAVRAAMEICAEDSPVMGADGRIKAHVCHINMVPVCVLGKYDGPVCGGCDNVRTQDEICALVRHFSQFGHVIFEGVVIGTIFDRYLRLDREMFKHGIPYVWAYLDTPLDLCLYRVGARREERGDTRPFNPDSTVKKHESTRRTRDKAFDAGLDVRDLRSDDGIGQTLIDWMGEDTIYDFQNSWREM